MVYNGFMDLKEVLEFLKKIYKSLLAFFAVGVFLGILVFSTLPKKYISSGTLFVGRTVTETQEFYSYSGYYDQQVALSFTNTVRGFLEDKNLHAQILKKLGTEATEKNIRAIDRKIRVKTAGPQLINVEVRSKSRRETEEIWETLVDETVKTMEVLNAKADSKLFIEKTNTTVLSRELMQNPFVFGGVGGLFLMGCGTVYIATKTYFYKESAPKES